MKKTFIIAIILSIFLLMNIVTAGTSYETKKVIKISNPSVISKVLSMWEYYDFDCSDYNDCKSKLENGDIYCESTTLSDISCTNGPQYEYIQVEITTCDSGWRCDGKYRYYQYSDCSTGSKQYCSNGCSDGECIESSYETIKIRKITESFIISRVLEFLDYYDLNCNGYNDCKNKLENGDLYCTTTVSSDIMCYNEPQYEYKTVETTTSSSSSSSNSNCNNECSAGDKKCDGKNYYIECIKMLTDGCYKWSAGKSKCKEGTICEDGECVANVFTCPIGTEKKTTNLGDIQCIPIKKTEPKKIETAITGDVVADATSIIREVEEKENVVENIKKYSSKYPIVFVHGWGGDAERFSSYQEILDIDGIAKNMGFINTQSDTSICPNKWPKEISVSVEYYSKGKKNEGIPYYATNLNKAIDLVMECTKSNKVTLIAHSMGGLVSRKYMVDYGSQNIEKLITLATPHYGGNNIIKVGWIRKIISWFAGGELDAQQMIPGSDFLNALNNADCNNRPKIISIGTYTVADIIYEGFDLPVLPIEIKDCNVNELSRMDSTVPIDSTKLIGSTYYQVEGCSHTDTTNFESGINKGSIINPFECVEAYKIVKDQLLS